MTSPRPPDRFNPRRRLKKIFGLFFGLLVSDRRHQPSLRIRLLVGALVLGTLPLLIASIILPTRVRSTLTETGHGHLIQVAKDLATLTQSEIQRHLETVRSLASVEALADTVRRHNAGRLDPAALATANRQLGAMLQGLEANQYQGLFLCGSDGIVFAGSLMTGETAAYAHVDIRDREYFRQVRTALKPVVSDPVKSKIADMPIIVVAVPFRDATGAFAGLVGLSIKIEHLTSIISGQKLGETGYPFAIDRHGIIVAHPDPQRAFKELARIPGATRLAARMLGGETGIETYVSSTGANKIAAFAPVPVAGWSVAASIETAEFVAPAQRIRVIIFAMIGACIVIAIVIAVTFAVGLDELKQALAGARASEARFKLFASVSNDTIWDWNIARDSIWWNKSLASAAGYAPGEVEHAAKVFDRWMPAADRARVAAGIRSCAAGGNWSGEHYFLRQDGTLAYVLHRAMAVRDAEGRTVRVLGSMTDISERRTAEERLAEQAALLNQTRDGILVRNLNHVVQFWNQGAEQLYGWTSAEAVGRRLDELLQIDPVQFAEAGRRVLQDGEWFGHLNKTAQNGIQLTVDCRWTLVRDEKGRPKSILSIDTDVSERLLMEAKFLRTQRLESIGTLAGGIAHDMNNLLSPIIMGVEMLRHAQTPEADQKVLQYIEQSARRGTELVKQVLSFARGIEGARVSVHVGYVAREVEAITRSTFPKDITVRVEIPQDLWLITADPTQVNQILLNLCVNARDAMPAGGQLTLTATNVRLDELFSTINREVAPGAYVLIEVADTGTGIPREVLEKIFEPFFTTKAPGKGTGLGLSTVIGITRSHGGTVNVYSEPGKGSVFKVYLPASPEISLGQESRDTANLPPSGQGELILLVDDESVILAVTKQALEKHGYKVLVASDGAQAFAIYHQHRAKIALVLTDMMMPVMDGYALIAALRQVDPGVRIVAASGLHDNNNQIKAAEVEIKHFLCKPYTTSVLLSVIQAALVDPSDLPPSGRTSQGR